MANVLVTGGSGFVGSHCVLQLLEAGHRVRTTVRSAQRESHVRALLRVGGAEPGDGLGFAVADLEKDEGWSEAMTGCDYVLHVASPFPATLPKDEREIVRPAVEGTRRVLRAARDAGVKRVVVTSSFGAVGYGHPQRAEPFDETSWTNVESDEVFPYVKSKTLAERAAWDFIDAEGGQLELSVVNPVAVFGPVLGADYSTSILIVQRLMDGAVPALPRIALGVVDVRDVADLHLRAMTDPAARGERFLCVSGGFLTLVQIATALRGRLGSKAKRVPTRQVPNWLVHVASLADPALKQVLPELGKPRNATSEKAQRLLGWSPRSAEEAIAATAESMWELGLLRDAKRKRVA